MNWTPFEAEPLICPLAVTPFYGAPAAELARYADAIDDEDRHPDCDCYPLRPVVSLGLVTQTIDPVAFSLALAEIEPVHAVLGACRVYREPDADILTVPVQGDAIEALVAHLAKTVGHKPAKARPPHVLLARLNVDAGKNYHGDPVFQGKGLLLEEVSAGGLIKVRLEGKPKTPVVRPKAPGRPGIPLAEFEPTKTPVAQKKPATSLQEALNRLGGVKSAALGRLLGKKTVSSYRKAIRLVAEAPIPEGDRVQILGWILKGWETDHQEVGRTRTGLPLYRWRNERGQTRIQHSPPGSGRGRRGSAQSDSGDDGQSQQQSTSARKPQDEKAKTGKGKAKAKVDPGAIKAQIEELKASGQVTAENLAQHVEQMRSALESLTIPQITELGRELSLKIGGKPRKADLILATLELALSGRQSEQPAEKPGKKPVAARTTRTKGDPQQAIAAIQAEIQNLTPESANKIRDVFLGLTLAQIGEVKKQLQVSASGTKQRMAEELAKRLVARGHMARDAAAKAGQKESQQARKELQKPATADVGKPEKPTSKPILPPGYNVVKEDPEQGLIVGEDRTGQLHTAVEPSPEAVKKLAAGLEKALTEGRLYEEYQDGLVPLGFFTTLVRRANPDATLGEIYSALKQLKKVRGVELHTLNEVSKLGKTKELSFPAGADSLETGTLWENGRAQHYVMLGRGMTPRSAVDKGSEGAETQEAQVGQQPQEQKPQKPQLQQQPRPKPAATVSDHAVSVGQHLERLAEKNGNLVAFSDLGEAAGLNPEETRKAILELRKTGAVSLSNHEGRHGLDPKDAPYLFEEDGERLGYASIRDPKKLEQVLKEISKDRR